MTISLRKIVLILYIIAPVVICGLVLAGKLQFGPRDFSVSYDGEYKGQFSGVGTFYRCVQSFDSPWYAEISLHEDNFTDPNADSVVIFLPENPETGTHSLVPTKDVEKHYTISVFIYEDNNRISTPNESLIAGKVTLNSIPNKPHRRVKGSFFVEYPTVKVQGEFDFLEDNSSSYHCVE